MSMNCASSASIAHGASKFGHILFVAADESKRCFDPSFPAIA
jgi:hypothetical protein